MDGNGNVSEEAYRGMWTPSNQKGNLPIKVSEGGSVIDESLVENGSYLRLKYFSIGYNLPKNISRKLKLNAIKIFISGNNIFTLTRYSGMNPDVSLFHSGLKIWALTLGGIRAQNYGQLI